MKKGNFFYELWELICAFFVSPRKVESLTITTLNHFPFSGYKAMMWCGYYVSRTEEKQIPADDLKHEEIHLMQAKVYKAWLGFYLKYVIEWFKGNPFTSPGESAYHTIPFEIEAYANEDVSEYVSSKESLNGKYDIKKRKETFINHKKEWRSYIKSL